MPTLSQTSLQLPQVVGGDEHRRAVFGDVLHDERPDLAAHDGVKPVQRLIQDEQLRPYGDCQPEGRLLEHAARKTAHGLLEVQVKDLAQLLEAPRVEVRVDPAVELHHVQDGGLREVKDLVRYAEDPAFHAGVLIDGLPVAEDLAGVLAQHAGQVLHGGGLSGAVGTDEAVGPPRQGRSATVRPAHGGRSIPFYVPELNSHRRRPPSA